MSGLGRRVGALERAQLVDLDGYVRRAAARLGLAPDAAVAEGRGVLAGLERFGRDAATKRWAAELGLTAADYRARAAALVEQLRAHDANGTEENDGR